MTMHLLDILIIAYQVNFVKCFLKFYKLLFEQIKIEFLLAFSTPQMA